MYPYPPLRRLPLFLGLIFIFCQCNPKDEAKQKRAIIVAELKRFQTAVKTRDAVAFASFFQYPFPSDSCFFAYVDTSIHGSTMLSKDWMIAEFPQFKLDASDGGMLLNLFKHCPLNRLNKEDSLKVAVKHRNEGCIYLYNIDVKDDRVHLQYGTNTNEDYLKAHGSPNDAEVCGEYAIGWEMKLVDNKLVVSRIWEAD